MSTKNINLNYLKNISNDSCVLIQFINENNKVQVGYKNWIYRKDQDNLSKIIELKSETTIQWPDNLEIAEAGVLASKLKVCKTWSTYPCKILAEGGKDFLINFLQLNINQFT